MKITENELKLKILLLSQLLYKYLPFPPVDGSINTAKIGNKMYVI